MSYILDALRKAEAERERGNVPGIHAQPAFAGARPSGAPARSRAWIVALALAALLIVAGAAYLLLGRDPAATTAATVARAPVPIATVAPTPEATIAPAITLPAPVPAAVPITEPVTTPIVPVPVPTRKPRAAASAPAVPTASTPASAAAMPKPEERVVAMSELPDDIRRQLPALAVGGSVYSPTPASRLVIVNGQVLHEGERIGADLLVQQIRQKAAVLSFKGSRFLLPF